RILVTCPLEVRAEVDPDQIERAAQARDLRTVSSADIHDADTPDRSGDRGSDRVDTRLPHDAWSAERVVVGGVLSMDVSALHEKRSRERDGVSRQRLGGDPEYGRTSPKTPEYSELHPLRSPEVDRVRVEN